MVNLPHACLSLLRIPFSHQSWYYHLFPINQFTSIYSTVCICFQKSIKLMHKIVTKYINILSLCCFQVTLCQKGRANHHTASQLLWESRLTEITWSDRDGFVKWRSLELCFLKEHVSLHMWPEFNPSVPAMTLPPRAPCFSYHLIHWNLWNMLTIIHLCYTLYIFFSTNDASKSETWRDPKGRNVKNHHDIELSGPLHWLMIRKWCDVTFKPAVGGNSVKTLDAYQTAAAYLRTCNLEGGK